MRLQAISKNTEIGKSTIMRKKQCYGADLTFLWYRFYLNKGRNPLMMTRSNLPQLDPNMILRFFQSVRK